MDEAYASCRDELIEQTTARNVLWFDAEIDKLDSWAEDRRRSLKSALNDLDTQIKEARRSARMAPNLPEKLNLQRELRNLESKRAGS